MPKRSSESDLSAARGALIRQRREARNWSQAELAQKAGTSQQTIDRIERGVTEFSRALPQVLAVLGLEGDDAIIHLERSVALLETLPHRGTRNPADVSYPGPAQVIEKGGRGLGPIIGLFYEVEDSLKAGIIRKAGAERKASAEGLIGKMSEIGCSFQDFVNLAHVVWLLDERQRDTLSGLANLRDTIVRPGAASDEDAAVWIQSACDLVASFFGRESATEPAQALGMLQILMVIMSTRFRLGHEATTAILHDQLGLSPKEND